MWGNVGLKSYGKLQYIKKKDFWEGYRYRLTPLTYRSVVNDDIASSHVAMENVLLQVLDEGALKRQGAALVLVSKRPRRTTQTQHFVTTKPAPESLIRGGSACSSC